VKEGLAFDDDNNQWVISSSDTNINYNYKDALDKAILFFEGQRSGKLPTNQRVDLVGGYYDAGDNVKFGWPMAFSVSLLSWAAIDSPGTEVAAEAAAALAAASIVFKKDDSTYSSRLLSHSQSLFEFADKYRGSYQASCPFYCSYSGYQDELLWGATWLYKATGNNKYLNYEFYGGKKELEKYKSDIESFVCAIMPGSSSQQIKTTPGGLLYIRDSSNLQYVTTSTMVLSIYANTLNSAHIGGTVQCGSTKFSPSQITAFAKSQVDYILGNNPMKTSYMVGFGNKYPTQLHHRGSSIPSLRTHQAKVSCNEGQTLYFPSTKPNPNVHVGALVGGPNSNDQFNDVRSDYSHLEPSTYINAAFVGSVAPFIAQNHIQQQQQSSLVIMQKSN
ncbi:hypothetical protein F8388_018038, partial [Cannabis sativa]